MEQQIREILGASTRHDNERLQKALDTYKFADCSSADVLDSTTGRCPLHVAIASCDMNAAEKSNEDETAARIERGGETVRLLLENGAIWNQLDNNDETPGCLAYRLQLQDLYQLMVDAGVRAEMLLNRLDGYEELADDDDEEVKAESNNDGSYSNGDVRTQETSDIGQRPAIVTTDVDSASYLSSVLSFDTEKLLDDQSNGVMMAWEREIMERSASGIVDKPKLKVLNIGAGMLIFDSFVQAMPENKPTEHHIVEAHPDVLADIKAKGWLEKLGVFVHAGKWQDVLPRLVAEGHTFDAIFFDTFAESYADFKDFFSEQVIGLLEQEGKWSFFNGMGADRQISYDVYQKVVEMDLFECGFDVDWQQMEIPVLSKEWEGVKRKYWNVESYRLPICSFMG